MTYIPPPPKISRRRCLFCNKRVWEQIQHYDNLVKLECHCLMIEGSFGPQYGYTEYVIRKKRYYRPCRLEIVLPAVHITVNYTSTIGDIGTYIGQISKSFQDGDARDYYVMWKADIFIPVAKSFRGWSRESIEKWVSKIRLLK